MKWRALRFCLVVAGLMLSVAPARAAEAGFTLLKVPYANTELDAAIWYPTNARPARLQIGPYAMTVASDAPVSGAHLPLIVMSHGNGGAMLSHEDTAIALARAGFVAASIEHQNDNYREHSAELELWQRSPQISALIDTVLRQWRGRAAIDPARIGMFGFSAGGFTTLVAIGGKPDFARIKPYCATHPHEFVCTLQQAHHDLPAEPSGGDVWHSEPRIRAAVIAAPALGFTFGPTGLAKISVPIQLWAAEDDHVLPVADNALAVKNALPRRPEFHMVRGADHFDFLPPCSPALAAVASAICSSPKGFDRAAFHARFNDAVTAFFAHAL